LNAFKKIKNALKKKEKNFSLQIYLHKNLSKTSSKGTFSKKLSLNSRLYVCKAGALWLEPCLQPQKELS
jgi:hypothetical protein